MDDVAVLPYTGDHVITIMDKLRNGLKHILEKFQNKTKKFCGVK